MPANFSFNPNAIRGVQVLGVLEIQAFPAGQARAGALVARDGQELGAALRKAGLPSNFGGRIVFKCFEPIGPNDVQPAISTLRAAGWRAARFQAYESEPPANPADLGARAFTTGNQIAFGASPSQHGLMAHELTHVVQQRSANAAPSDAAAQAQEQGRLIDL